MLLIISKGEKELVTQRRTYHHTLSRLAVAGFSGCHPFCVGGHTGQPGTWSSGRPGWGRSVGRAHTTTAGPGENKALLTTLNTAFLTPPFIPTPFSAHLLSYHFGST